MAAATAVSHEQATEVIPAVPPPESGDGPDAGFVVYDSPLVGEHTGRFDRELDGLRDVQPHPADLEEGPIDGPSAGADPAGAYPYGAHPSEPTTGSPLSGFGGEPEAYDSPTSFVRPYVLTRGRTRSQYELSIETLVSAQPVSANVPIPAEHEAVIALCQEPRSVAEVAALLRIPLGVARVLLGDMVANGIVAVHRTVGVAGPDVALMERVLAGLRRL